MSAPGNSFVNRTSDCFTEFDFREKDHAHSDRLTFSNEVIFFIKIIVCKTHQIPEIWIVQSKPLNWWRKCAKILRRINEEDELKV